MSALFTPLQVGAIKLSHRVVMAPLTRFRADETSVHHEIAADYYGQRATPGGPSSPKLRSLAKKQEDTISYIGIRNVPGIWNDAQVAGWKKVTDRVHSKGGFIFVQLWALGRAADPAIIRSLGHKFVAPSAIGLEGSSELPEPLTKDDIARYVEMYVHAAKKAMEAGFDGVEIHNANGYLLDQFLQTVSNERTDEFGGSVENRARFSLLVAKAVTSAIGEDRVGIRFSPWSKFQDMRMPDPVPTFSYIIEELRDRFPALAYVHAVEGRVAGNVDQAAPASENSDFARAIWNAKGERAFLSAGGYSVGSDLAAKTVEAHGGAVVVGRAFVSNPDLVDRIRNGLEWTQYDRSTFYNGQGPTASQGYSDYPVAGQVPVSVSA